MRMEKKNVHALSASSATMKLIVLSSIALLAAVNADDWSYLCLGMKHGCVLAQKEGSAGGVDGFCSAQPPTPDSSLTHCHDLTPQCTRSLASCLARSASSFEPQ